MVKETSEQKKEKETNMDSTSAAQLSDKDYLAKQTLPILEEYFMRLTGLKPRLIDTEIGIHTGISTQLNVGYVLYLFYPGAWSENGLQDLRNYGPQVGKWIAGRLTKVAGGEMSLQPWVVDEREEEDINS